jgi:hypothetical protein
LRCAPLGISIALFKGMRQSMYVDRRTMDAIVPSQAPAGNLESPYASPSDRIVIAP